MPGSSVPDAVVLLFTCNQQSLQGTERGDDREVVLLQFRLGQVYLNARRLEEAEAMLEASMAYNRRIANDEALGATYRETGRARLEQKKYDEAWSLLQKGIGLQRESAYARG